MALPADPDFQARLQALNEKYAASIPTTLARLEAARGAFGGATPDRAQADALHEILHTIAGSAGTFGFGAFGQHARTLTESLRTLRARDDVTESEWQGWLGRLDTFRAWAAKNPSLPPESV